MRSAHAPFNNMPTTRAPRGGPPPSLAASSTTPAKSQPGRQPGSAAVTARFVSPRLSEIAVTRTVASVAAAGASFACCTDSLPDAFGSTTMALI
jgi:hypothetical protein